MSTAQRDMVRQRYPSAWAWPERRGQWKIMSSDGFGAYYIGDGTTRDKAWANAALRLNEPPEGGT